MSAAKVRIEKQMPPDALYLNTQMAVIQSEPVLFQVITNLDLNHKWALLFREPGDFNTEISFAILKSKLNVRQFPSTALIEIRVTSEDKEEAAVIANEIGKIFCETANQAAKEIGVSLKASVLETAHPALRSIRPSVLRYGIASITCLTIGTLLFWRAFRKRKAPPLPG